jgi:hypothetical protein
MKKIIAYAVFNLLLVSCSNVGQLSSVETNKTESSNLKESFNIYFEAYFDIQVDDIVFNNENKYKIDLPNLNKATYNFEGWFFDENFKEVFNINKLNGDTKLYSKWNLPRIENKDILESLVILPETEYDNLETLKMISRLETLGQDILLNTYNYGTRLHLINTPLSYHPDWIQYRNEITTNGGTIDLLPGAGRKETKQAYVRIGYSELGKGHGALNLELHELAHLINDAYKEESKTELFNNIWQKEKDKAREMLMINGHYDREEYFCEMFSYYFYSFETRRLVYYHAPETYNFMKERFSWGGN